MNRLQIRASDDATRPSRSRWGVVLAISVVLGALTMPALLGVRIASAASTTVVISQFQVAGSGDYPPADEFVELHNVGTSSLDLDGMRLVYRSASGTTDVNLRVWSESTPIPPGGYYLLGHTQGYDGPAADASIGASTDNGVIAASGGGLALRQGAANTGTIIDSVGYGTATNAFVETTRTVAPAAGSSRARGDSGCTETDDNSVDFEGLTPSSPRSSNSPRFVCGAAPALQLRKSAAPDTYAAVDEVIAYRYRVTNSGNVRLAGPVRVEDDRVNVDCPAVTSVGDGDGYLDPLEEIVCSASHTVTQADVKRGSITNTASATADEVSSDPDTLTVDAVRTDTEPPRVSRPSVRFATGQQVLRSQAVPITTRWAARDTDSGIASGMGQRRSPATSWRPFTRLRATTSVTTKRLLPGEGPFHQRARATDRAGNTSRWAAAPWFSLRTLQGDEPGRMSWRGAWKAVQGRKLLGARAWRSSTRGDRLDVRLDASATDAALVASVTPWAGRIRVFVDGDVGPIIDLRSPVVRHRLIVWSSRLRGRQPHDISFVVLGWRSPGNATPSVQLDAVLAMGDLGSGWTHWRPEPSTPNPSEGSSEPDHSSEPDDSSEPGSPPEAGHQAGAGDPLDTEASPGDDESPDASDTVPADS